MLQIAQEIAKTLGSPRHAERRDHPFATAWLWPLAALTQSQDVVARRNEQDRWRRLIFTQERKVVKMTKKRFPSAHGIDIKKTTEIIARRIFLERAAGFLAAAGVAGGVIQTANAAQKFEKDDVSYQDSPKGGNSCANCKYWDGDSACEIVEGEVTADAWCAVWAPA